jgi:predicted nuclease of predicted toxin-antitoxin system
MARLLFDQNLSYRLCASLVDVFPQSVHVRDVGLARADDLTVWTYAKDNGLTIVTKDGDFSGLSFVYGSPPKIVWLRVATARRTVHLRFCGARRWRLPISSTRLRKRFLSSSLAGKPRTSNARGRRGRR